MANKKPGYLTSELWVTLASLVAIYQLVSLAVATDSMAAGIAVAGGGIGMGLVALGYNESRKAK